MSARASASTSASARARAADDMTSEELSAFTQKLLEQMQARFQTMSDAIITKIDDMQERIEALERGVNDIASAAAKGGGEGAR